MRLDILATYSRQRKKELKEDRETNYCFLTEALFRIIIEKANGIIEFILEKPSKDIDMHIRAKFDDKVDLDKLKKDFKTAYSIKEVNLNKID